MGSKGQMSVLAILIEHNQGWLQAIKLKLQLKILPFYTFQTVLHKGTFGGIAVLVKWIQSVLSVSLMKFNRSGAGSK